MWHSLGEDFHDFFRSELTFPHGDLVDHPCPLVCGCRAADATNGGGVHDTRLFGSNERGHAFFGQFDVIFDPINVEGNNIVRLRPGDHVPLVVEGQPQRAHVVDRARISANEYIDRAVCSLAMRPEIEERVAVLGGAFREDAEVILAYTFAFDPWRDGPAGVKLVCRQFLAFLGDALK